jgi:hypothetical protein
LAAHCEKHGLPAFPCLLARFDICRGDLLFEIELDAVRLTPAAS